MQRRRSRTVGRQDESTWELRSIQTQRQASAVFPTAKGKFKTAWEEVAHLLVNSVWLVSCLEGVATQGSFPRDTKCKLFCHKSQTQRSQQIYISSKRRLKEFQSTNEE